MSKTNIVAPSPARNGVLAFLLIASTIGSLVEDMQVSGMLSDVYTVLTGLFAVGSILAVTYFLDSRNPENYDAAGHWIGQDHNVEIVGIELPKWILHISAFIAGIAWAINGYLKTHGTGINVPLGMVMMGVGLFSALAVWADFSNWVKLAKQEVTKLTTVPTGNEPPAPPATSAS